MLVRIIGGHGGVSPGFRATSYMIDSKLMIDAGSLATGLRIEEQLQIDHILISHCHLDHIKDLAFLADNCFGQKGKSFEVYSNKEILHAIKTHLLNDVIWPDFTKLPKVMPTFHLNEIVPEKKIEIDRYKITPIYVNHPGPAMGYIVEDQNSSVLFTLDTGPTERIWEVSHEIKNLKAIVTEVSFPNKLQKVATESQHHTPQTLKAEIQKMPKDIPIFLGHLKPNYQTQLFKEVAELDEKRITLLGSDNATYLF